MPQSFVSIITRLTCFYGLFLVATDEEYMKTARICQQFLRDGSAILQKKLKEREKGRLICNLSKKKQSAYFFNLHYTLTKTTTLSIYL